MPSVAVTTPSMMAENPLAIYCLAISCEAPNMAHTEMVSATPRIPVMQCNDLRLSILQR
jgi:hypothetical protein